VIGLTQTAAILAAALVLDRLIGDPPRIWRSAPHPVALMGRAVGWLDARLNDPRLEFAKRRRRGVMAVLLLLLAAAALGTCAHYFLALVPFGAVAEAIIVSVLLAQKSLVDHVAAVGRALASGNLTAGRREVARIVGRDVTQLDEAGVARGAIESGAENFPDGVVAPAFWYALLGLPGILVYKAMNTADSMIGNRSERHEAFGWAAARIDDLLNLIPARLSAILIVAAAPLMRCDAGGSVAALGDAPKHKSPNAGWPEAAVAGALGLALGGPRRYGKVAVDGAWLNAGGRMSAGPADITAAIRLLDLAWALLLVFVCIGVLIGFGLSR
jgi:adenosylcobinamide-phosphate synthase